MIMEILSFYNGSAEDQQQLADDLEHLGYHQQLALRVYLEYDDSLLSYMDLNEAVELAEDAFQGQHDSGGDFAMSLMDDIDPDFAEKVDRYMPSAVWVEMWDYSLSYDYSYVEVDGVGYVIRQM